MDTTPSPFQTPTYQSNPFDIPASVGGGGYYG